MATLTRQETTRLLRAGRGDFRARRAGSAPSQATAGARDDPSDPTDPSCFQHSLLRTVCIMITSSFLGVLMEATAEPRIQVRSSVHGPTHTRPIQMPPHAGPDSRHDPQPTGSRWRPQARHPTPTAARTAVAESRTTPTAIAQHPSRPCIAASWTYQHSPGPGQGREIPGISWGAEEARLWIGHWRPARSPDPNCKPRQRPLAPVPCSQSGPAGRPNLQRVGRRESP